MANTVAAVLPALTASLSGTPVPQASLDVSLPKIRAAIDGNPYVAGTLTPTLPALEAVVGGGDAIAATMTSVITASITGDAGTAGDVTASLSLLTSGIEAATSTTGDVSVQLPSFTALLGQQTGVSGSITGTLTRASSTVAGSPAITGTTATTLPSVGSSLYGTAVAFATIDAALPAVSAFLRSGTTSTQLLTHVMNVTSRAVSTFEDYAFNSMTYFAGKYLGAGSTGLFQIDAPGSTENITATLSGGKLDFGSEMRKRCDNFYLAMRSEGPVTLRVSVDENDPYEYDIDPLLISTLKQRRSLVGKGLIGKYWNFELECAYSFDYDTMNISVVPQSRRI